ncbi:MAG TPA: hypothetical protein VGO73_00935 [Pyrinomonadaceae bacterium]|nr:hypothetical protein [Pyrinomonadaceae bacterium]
MMILFLLTVSTAAWLLVFSESTRKRASQSFWPALIRNPEIEGWVNFILVLIVALVSTLFLAIALRAVLLKR